LISMLNISMLVKSRLPGEFRERHP
jgi:hypothetical protein